jgi:hypothetical protein
MLGKSELAAADRGMGDFNHVICPPTRLRGVLYRAAGAGGKREEGPRVEGRGPREKDKGRTSSDGRSPVPQSPAFAYLVHSALRAPHSALETAVHNL